MKEITYWFKKYSSYIIVFLLAVLLIKSCKSCSSERLNNYNIKQLEIAHSNDMDSLLNIILYKEFEYDSIYNIKTNLEDSLTNITYENNMLKAIISEVKNDKEYYKKQNRNLVNMANNLSKKDTIK